jgi:colanic acid/amylovoran biosynthesis glycosyltransferase
MKNIKPLRILFVTPKPFSYSEVFVLEQAKALVDSGYHVEICFLYGKQSNFFLSSNIRLTSYAFLNKIIFPCKIISLRVSFLSFPFLFFLKNLNYGKNLIWLTYEDLASSFSFKIWRKTMIPFNEKGYDIIHCQFANIASEVVSLREEGVLKGKIIVHFRGYDISSHIQEKGQDVYSEIFKKSDYFLANCDFFKEKAISIGCDKKKICTYGTPLDCEKFYYTKPIFPKDGKIKLITVGRLVEKKGIEYGIRAMEKIVKVFPDIEYTIVGDGELRKSLEDLTLRLGLSNFVKFVGWKKHDEIYDFLKNTHIFISPNVIALDGNLDAPTNTIKEAMSSGVLVVSSDYPPIFELIQDTVNGFLFKQRNHDDLADKIIFLINTPEIWEKVAKKARNDVVNKYDKEKLRNELIDLYGKIVRGEV